MGDNFLFSIVFFSILFIITKAKIQQVHVLFRHGHRTPDLVSLYPKDPYLHDTYYPDGLGALTKQGKLLQYEVGQYLRYKYNDFLGEIYTPDVMDDWTTDFNRTKMSLLTLMAGLWPPTESQIWNPLLNWQPIPFNYVANKDDTLLRMQRIYCKKFIEEYNIVKQTAGMKDYLKRNSALIKYLNKNSGLNCTNTFDLFILYFGLNAEEKNGKILPEWTKQIYPKFLEEATILEYEFQAYNDQMKKVVGGQLLKKILTDFSNKINGTLIPEDRKIFLYSAHEYNIALMLLTLNLFKPHVPPYSAFFILELHEIDNDYSIKILYQDYSGIEPHVLVLPGCEEYCPYYKFLKLTSHVLPGDNEILC